MLLQQRAVGCDAVKNAIWFWKRKGLPGVRRVEGRVCRGGKSSAVGLLSGVGSYKVLGAP